MTLLKVGYGSTWPPRWLDELRCDAVLREAPGFNVRSLGICRDVWELASQGFRWILSINSIIYIHFYQVPSAGFLVNIVWRSIEQCQKVLWSVQDSLFKRRRDSHINPKWTFTTSQHTSFVRLLASYGVMVPESPHVQTRRWFCSHESWGKMICLGESFSVLRPPRMRKPNRALPPFQGGCPGHRSTAKGWCAILAALVRPDLFFFSHGCNGCLISHFHHVASTNLFDNLQIWHQDSRWTSWGGGFWVVSLPGFCGSSPPWVKGPKRSKGSFKGCLKI